jgi:hypothetical protein
MSTNDTSGAEPSLSYLNRRSHKEILSIIVKPDGRACRCCGVLDSARDQTNSSLESVLWGYAPRVDGRNTGNICYYCLRVLQAQFESKGFNIKSLAERIGSCGEFQKEFNALRSLCVAHFQVQGGCTRGMAVDWQAVRKTMASYKSSEVTVQNPISHGPRMGPILGPHEAHASSSSSSSTSISSSGWIVKSSGNCRDRWRYLHARKLVFASYGGPRHEWHWPCQAHVQWLASRCDTWRGFHQGLREKSTRRALDTRAW